MASGKTIAWIDRLVWILIYGGLLTLVLGLASLRQQPAAAWSLIVLGGVLAAAGVVLIRVRARLDRGD